MTRSPRTPWRPRSLRAATTLWFGVVFLVLYLIASVVIYGIDQRNNRRDIRLLLYSEAEALATYYAATGRLDFPELAALSTSTPVPVWLRLTRNGDTLRATPGFPGLEPPEASSDPARLEGLVAVRETAELGEVAVVLHPVWDRPGQVVEAVASLRSVDRGSHSLVVALVVTPLVLAPLAALGGRFLAVRSLRPVEGLVAAMGRIDSIRLSERLDPAAAPEEIARLVREVNLLLDRLEEAVLGMRDFTADASHELRTPVSILRTGLEVALRRERSVEEYRALLAESLVEIERVERVVEGLLTLARNAGQEPPPIPTTAVSLSEVAAGALDSVEPVAAERGVELAAAIEPDVEVAGDEDRLRMALLNLLDNAIKYTPSGAAVRLSLTRADSRAHLSVTDEGPGIAAEDRPHVFERFYRGRRPARAGGDGRRATGGLGLAVVRWVVESHRGTIHLGSGPGGRGTAVEITLPALT